MMETNEMLPARPGDHVKELMIQRRWSQAELAYVLGVTTATVNQVVNSKRPITPEMAKLLAVAFDRPAETTTHSTLPGPNAKHRPLAALR